MRILWLTWKDMKHPLAGGAELVNEELGKKLVADGHHVVYLVSGWKGCDPVEERDGFTVIRLGNRYTVYWKVYRYYKKYLKGKFDLVIDECNTIPFFAKFYVKERTVFFIQQLAREVWFYQIFFPLNLIGYLLEPLYIRLFNSERTFTFAASTKEDLIKYGFDPDEITLLTETYTIQPCESIEAIKKCEKPSILFFSALRRMKRPHHVILAFEIAKKKISELRLEVVGGGSGPYARRVTSLIEKSRFRNDITYHGAVWDETKKIELMQRNHFICCTSVREGWGIIVSEAGSQGTPAITYNIHGLRDAVDHGRAGIVCNKNTPYGLAMKICEAFSDMERYPRLQEAAHRFACGININTSYRSFIKKL